MITANKSLVNHVDNADWVVMRKGSLINYINLDILRGLFGEKNDDLRRHQALTVINDFFRDADGVDIDLHFLYKEGLVARYYEEDHISRSKVSYLREELEDLLSYFEKRVYGGDE